MTKWFQSVIWSILVLVLLSPPLTAQENETAPSPLPVDEEAAPAEPDGPAGQEVEINEDNYRQFMELKDAMRQRDIIPENIFKPGSGLQKLEKLPEESQKHLRNQLREIIVQGDPWQPGDEETEYPYTPSAAAGTDPVLEKQELEAWGELVDSYHDRESQIYENSSGSRAARGSEQGSSSSPQNGTGQPGSSSRNGEGSQGQQAGQEAQQQSNPDQTVSEGTFSLNGSSDPNANNTAGVSQNAMEFLKGMGQGGSGTGSSGQAQGQGDQPKGAEQDSVANNGTSNPAGHPNAEITAGTSQNALEFLNGAAGQSGSAGRGGSASSEGQEGLGEAQEGEQGESEAGDQEDDQDDGQTEDGEDGQDDGQKDGEEDNQADDQGNEQTQEEQQTEVEESDSTFPPAISDPASPGEDEESNEGTSQNALDYLTGDSDQPAEGNSVNEPDTTQPAGTLSIQDLLNARGVGESTGTNPASNRPVDDQQPDENTPDNDGGG